MTIEEIAEQLESFRGVLTLRPGPDDGSPEISWGDLFFYYSPDGAVPHTQPFATIVTKDYPDDTSCRLDRDGTFRVNIAAGRAEFDRWTAGQSTAGPLEPADDTVIAHPVYGGLGWLAVTNPGPRTEAAVRDLLRLAYDQARTRAGRRADAAGN